MSPPLWSVRRSGNAAGRLPAYSLLPKTLPFLLFPRLHRQRFVGDQGVSRLAVRELELYGSKPFIGGRKPQFIYFGGGTPSYLSEGQLED